MGVDFSGISGDMEERAAAAVRQILAMDASPEYKKKRLLELLRRTGNAYHDQLFEASSEVFDSTAIQAARHDAKEQAERLATKLLRNNALNRETIDRLMGSYYNSLQGSAQEEAFRNAQSMQKHPTLTRSVNGVGDCKWCVSKSGTYTNPKGDDFRRHAKCDCKFEVSGYRSRNGELRNYSKKGGKSKNEKAKASTPVDYSKLPKAHPDHLEPHEQAFYNRWKDKLGLERIPNTKDGKVKNDFVDKNGVEWELKSVLKAPNKFTVRNEFFRATDKGKRNILLDVVDDSTPVDRIISDTKKHLGTVRKSGGVNGDLVDRVIIFKKDDKHVIK